MVVKYTISKVCQNSLTSKSDRCVEEKPMRRVRQLIMLVLQTQSLIANIVVFIEYCVRFSLAYALLFACMMHLLTSFTFSVHSDYLVCRFNDAVTWVAFTSAMSHFYFSKSNLLNFMQLLKSHLFLKIRLFSSVKKNIKLAKIIGLMSIQRYI